ncbi:MAG: glycosyltransferase [Planctomycetota bacterium]
MIEPIRVGFVMHKMQVAGAEVLVRQIIECLGGKVDATVLCLDGLGDIGQQLQDKGVPVIVLNRKPGFDRGLAGRLANEIKKRRIQLLHAHQYTPFFYSAVAKMWHRLRCKILFTEHGRHYPDVVSAKRRWINRLLLQRYADVTTACCDFSTLALQKTEGFSQAFTLRNGVELDKLPDRNGIDTKELRYRLGLDQGRSYVACIARFHPVKDHATLIRGWFNVHADYPAARLLLVGDGPSKPQIEQQIVELSRSAGSFADSIQFLGIRQDVPDLLRAVDVFTLTSVSEAASLTLLEAMASGAASIVTNVGGNAEHLREGKDGYLVPRGDDQALASRLKQLLANPEKARALGQSARSRVVEEFDLNKVVQQYMALYQSLVAQTSTDTPSPQTSLLK